MKLKKVLYPIEILHNNLCSFFEKTNDYSLNLLQQYIKDGKLTPELIIETDEEKIKFPKATLDGTNQIIIQNTYLSHLWSFIYSIFVIYEEEVQKKMIQGTYIGIIDDSSNLINRAIKLLEWSFSLKDKYSDWDIHLPNPDIDYTIRNKETFYIEKVNNIYQSATSFLLYHEVAHLVNGHKPFFLGFNKDLSIKAGELKELEKEADEFAFSILINNDSEDSKIQKGMAIIIVFCSSLILSNLNNLQQSKHPDIDQRLLIMLSKLNFEKIENEFYLWYLGCVILNIYLKREGIKELPQVCNTHKELFFKYLDILDNIKQHLS